MRESRKEPASPLIAPKAISPTCPAFVIGANPSAPTGGGMRNAHPNVQKASSIREAEQTGKGVEARSIKRCGGQEP